MAGRKGQPPVPTGTEHELSVEELIAEIEAKKKQLVDRGVPDEDIPADAYPNYYWECIDSDSGGVTGHPIYRWVGPKGGYPTCPVCGSNRAYERGKTPPVVENLVASGITEPSAPTS